MKYRIPVLYVVFVCGMVAAPLNGWWMNLGAAVLIGIVTGTVNAFSRGER